MLRRSGSKLKPLLSGRVQQTFAESKPSILTDNTQAGLQLSKRAFSSHFPSRHHQLFNNLGHQIHAQTSTFSVENRICYPGSALGLRSLHWWLRSSSRNAKTVKRRIEKEGLVERKIDSRGFNGGLWREYGTRAPVQHFSYSSNALYDGVSGWAKILHEHASSVHNLWPAYSLKNLKGVFWPAERWLLVSGVMRDSICWVPDFVEGILRPGRWACVAAVTSLNTVGAHVPRMVALMLAQAVGSMRSAEGLSRETLYPWKEMQKRWEDQQAAIAANWAKQVQLTVSKLMRFGWLFLNFLPLVLTSPLAWGMGWFREQWILCLRRTLENCGPAFIKWGQWAATRRDLFPLDVCLELQKLQTAAPSHSFEVSKEAVESAFGIPLHDLFSEFDEEPVASGSIGQVHHAVMGTVGSGVTGVAEGTEVAVKVRHPGVDVAFQRDLDLMQGIAHLLCYNPMLKNFRLEETIKQFAAPMAEQVDLCIEAANLRCFNHNFRNDTSIEFPEPLFPLITPGILVETFHRGQSIQELVDLHVQTEGKSKLAALGSSTFFDMLILHNLIHADLHPGNILVQFSTPDSKLLDYMSKFGKKLGKDFGGVFERIRRGVEGSEPRIVLLDAGMATQLSGKEQNTMRDLFRAFAELDGKGVGKATLAFAGDRQSCEDPAAFQRDLDVHFALLRNSQNWEDTHFDTGLDALASCLDLVRQHGVNIPGQVCSVLFSVFVLEGWSSKLDPDHSVMTQAKQLIQKFDWTWKIGVAHGMSSDWDAGDSRLQIV